MDAYSRYRFIIKLKSPFGTPWQADTIMGHLVWLVAHQGGRRGSKKFPCSFHRGKPPFVISDGFPAGLLPRPLGYRQNPGAKDLDSYANEKVRRKAEFLTLCDFEAIRSGGKIEIDPVSFPWIGIQMLHAAISRETGTTGEGGNLFATNAWILRHELWKDGEVLLSIYAYILEDWIERMERMVADLSIVGFGKDKSVGLGQFEFLRSEKWDGFSGFKEANGFISLSTFVPAINDPVEGKWAINIKYGKLGENAGDGNPFKKPLLQFKPGAVFYTDEPLSHSMVGWLRTLRRGYLKLYRFVIVWRFPA